MFSLTELLTEAWWFPILAIVLAAFALTLLCGFIGFASDRTRRLFGGMFIITIVAATVFSYAYAVLSPLQPGYNIEAECLGAPYDTCG